MCSLGNQCPQQDVSAMVQWKAIGMRCYHVKVYAVDPKARNTNQIRTVLLNLKLFVTRNTELKIIYNFLQTLRFVNISRKYVFYTSQTNKFEWHAIALNKGFNLLTTLQINVPESASKRKNLIKTKRNLLALCAELFSCIVYILQWFPFGLPHRSQLSDCSYYATMVF